MKGRALHHREKERRKLSVFRGHLLSDPVHRHRVIRLQPAPEGTLVLGVHTMDMTDLGLIDPWVKLKTPIVASYTGAIADAEAVVRDLGDARKPFEQATTLLLDQGSVRRELRLSDPDPVVTPPFYGSFATGAQSVPGSGWMAELNLDPRRLAGVDHGNSAGNRGADQIDDGDGDKELGPDRSFVPEFA